MGAKAHPLGLMSRTRSAFDQLISVRTFAPLGRRWNGMQDLLEWERLGGYCLILWGLYLRPHSRQHFLAKGDVPSN